MRKTTRNLVVWRDIAIVPLLKPHTVKDLHSGLIELAHRLTNHPEKRGMLLLLGGDLSPQRVEEEIRIVEQAMRPELFERIQVLGLANRFSLQSDLEAAGLESDEARGIDEALRLHFTGKRPARVPRTAHDLVLEHLINAHFLGHGPMTTESIMAATGFSYPPVARALKALGSVIRRQQDRRVELRHFPSQEWQRFLGVYERGRFARKFSASPELARSPEVMLQRYLKRQLPGTAVSGVHAARQYFPDLDLVGAPRLDLCAHVSAAPGVQEVAKEIDPALKPVSFDTANPTLVIWPVHRVETSFLADPQEGIYWADPVSCLLALHDVRLEQQARELVDAFEEKRTTIKVKG